MPLSTIHLNEITNELEAIKKQASSSSSEGVDKLIQTKAVLLIATVLHDINENLIEIGNLLEDDD